MKLKVQTRMVYGRPLHYPMCDVSKLLVLLGRRESKHPRTFGDDDLRVLRLLGYEIEQVPEFGIAP